MIQENFSSDSFSHDIFGVKFSGLNLKTQNINFCQKHLEVHVFRHVCDTFNSNNRVFPLLQALF